ncbi:MAG: SGNH/GDSL hydrolase family protein [Limisphaerales bacterium]
MGVTQRTIIKRSIGGLLVIGLIAASAAAGILFKRAKHYYTAANAVRLDPLGLREHSTQSPPENLALVFYGDSRAAEWPEPSWLAGRTMNLGIGAQTTEQILGRFEHHLAPLRPDIVLLQAGINDLKAIPLLPEAETEIIDRCKQNIGSIVERCQEQGANVILTTIFPVGDLPLERRPFWSDRVDPAIAEVNQYIRSLESDRVVIIASEDALAGEDGHVTRESSRDFLHLSEIGYQQLNGLIRRPTESIISMAQSETTSKTTRAKQGAGNQLPTRREAKE